MKNFYLLIITLLFLINCHKKPSGTKTNFISTDEMITPEKHEFYTDVKDNGVFKLYDNEQHEMILSGAIVNLSPTQSGLQFNVAANNGLAMVKINKSYTEIVLNSSTKFFIFDSYDEAKEEYSID